MTWMTLWRPRSEGTRLSNGERTRKWRHFWRLVSSFWVSNQWKIAWPLFATSVALNYATIRSFVLMTNWEKALFDALDARQASALGPLVLQFVGISLLTVGLGVVQAYVTGMIKIRWRAWLTADYLERYLRHDRYLDIERTEQIDNPDQRIAEDIDLFTQQTLDVVLAVISMVVGAYTFGAILWEASRPIEASVAGMAVSIPGDLVVYGVLYAVGGSWLVTYVGRPLVRWTMEQQHLAANFRFRLVNVRRNAEQIAFARTISSEWRRLREDFARIFRNFRGVLVRQQGVVAAGGLYGSVGGVLPVFLLMPRYFAGQMTLGTVMQNRTAFGQFNASLSYFVQSYAAIATLVAVISRIRQLDWAIATPTPSGIAVSDSEEHGIQTVDLSLETPNGAPLASIGTWTVEQGERWTVRGPSGIGKSTLLRAIAGLWPYGAGRVAGPGRGHTMFLSQRTFLPIGTLKEAMCFPGDASSFGDDACRSALESFRLERLAGELHCEATWQDRLSPGEQQRLAFARVLLQRPDTLFLDEATSALDKDNAHHAYQTLLGTFPALTLVSVVHDPQLDQYHNRQLSIGPTGTRTDPLPDALTTPSQGRTA